jgi:hypothetical protein
VNKGLVVGGKLVGGLYNDSEAEGEGHGARFADLTKRDMLQAIRSWGLGSAEPLEGQSTDGTARVGRAAPGLRGDGARPDFERMGEDDLRAWLREHAVV